MKEITVGSDYSGVGAFDHAMNRVALKKNIKVNTIFACDFDLYARISYIANHGTPDDLILVLSKEHKTICQKVTKLILSDKKEYSPQEQKVFKEANQFATKFSFYYPFNVYDREIPTKSLDIYMTSPPCQSFSLAGKRAGKNDDQGKGILFFNSLNFIRKNKPRYFQFENVEGLLSDDKPTNSKALYGKTFQEWINYLGGKSVNGLPTLFPYEDAVDYHIYFKVMNSKDYGVPQNRKRIFIIGIRDDVDNNFTFPAEQFLEKRLKDVLEPVVDTKYILSEKMIESITFENKKNGEIANLNKGGERGSIYDENTNFMSCLSATDFKQLKQIISFKKIEVGTFRTHKDGNGFRKMKDDNIAPTISARAREDGSGQACIKIHANTKKGFDVMQEGDSLNLTNPKSKTRRGRVGVGVGVAQTLDTLCNQGVLQAQQTDYVIRKLTPLECFRLQDFPDSHVENCRKAGVDDFTQFKKGAISDSQLYKQAGNSITVKVLELNISKFNL